ncbi:LSM domain protein [Theileria parva strain Muguga]|uniref:Sm protein B n=1 Tax=Theileria parva TaxID=5875 RepID=Q4N5C8_THEPA|nr:LSM domain protein [Theileria parva strain Muguga]EAN32645.1 LSM domain protein [Theileria parva strain Muguga]|eukprot:XP_764928.1 small nuclear ribonucleoprotein B [Theileria parva strain Muguga]
MPGKNTRMQHWLQYNVRVTLKDNRKFVGTLVAYDKYMNLVLSDCEEFRMTLGKDKNRTEVKRTLGFVLLRGENIVSFTAKSPVNVPQLGYPMGPGKATPAGRGAPLMVPGMMQPGMPQMPAGGVALQAPMRGLVGSAPAQLQPQNVPATMPPMPN